MKRFLLTPAAETQLTDIWDYIASDNPAAATRVLDAFDSAFCMLAESPCVGHTTARTSLTSAIDFIRCIRT